MLTHHAHHRSLHTCLLLLFFLGCVLVPARPVSATPVAVLGALISTIDTSLWPNPSPDPSGITYWPERDTLLIVDGEVEEMNATIYRGWNTFESSRAGAQVASYRTLAFTNEPVGITYDGSVPDGRLFIADDSHKTIHEIRLGADRLFGTADDTRRSFSTINYGSIDPEGVAFGDGMLFITSGMGARLSIVEPGPNGTFDGALAPAGDDLLVASWDTRPVGQPDPEGVAYRNGRLFLISNKPGSNIAETDLAGNLLRTIDIQAIEAVAPADLAFAPSTTEPGVMNLFVVARGIDNSEDPNENDGRIYEIKITDLPPPPPPVPDGNFLTNGDFEADLTGDGPDHWSQDPRFTRTATVAKEGSFAARHHATDNTSFTIRQTIAGITSGAGYRFSGWVNIPPTADPFAFSLQVRWTDGDNDVISTNTITTLSASTSGWQEVVKGLVAPAGATGAILRMVNTSLNATIYVDDFDFRLNLSTPTGTRIKEITLEDGSLTHPTSGADTVAGAVTLEQTSPLHGGYSARITNAGSSYLEENFSAVNDLYFTFALRIAARPSSSSRVATIMNNGTVLGNLVLLTSGKLQLKIGGTAIGTSTIALTPGTHYQIALHQQQGTGADGVLEAFIALDGDPLTRFAATTTGTWTLPANRVRLGATTSTLLNATFDEAILDTVQP